MIRRFREGTNVVNADAVEDVERCQGSLRKTRDSTGSSIDLAEVACLLELLKIREHFWPVDERFEEKTRAFNITMTTKDQSRMSQAAITVSKFSRNEETGRSIQGRAPGEERGSRVRNNVSRIGIFRETPDIC